jgi:hypothetical protein
MNVDYIRTSLINILSAVCYSNSIYVPEYPELSLLVEHLSGHYDDRNIRISLSEIIRFRNYWAHERIGFVNWDALANNIYSLLSIIPRHLHEETHRVVQLCRDNTDLLHYGTPVFQEQTHYVNHVTTSFPYTIYVAVIDKDSVH